MKSYEEFVNDGGTPSGSPFSSYTKVCSALKKYKAAVGSGRVNYMDVRQRALFLELQRTVSSSLSKTHKATFFSRSADAKADQQGAVDSLAGEVEEEGRICQISTWLEFPTKMALVANTQSALKNLFSRGELNIRWSTNKSINAQLVGRQTLDIYWPAFEEAFKKWTPLGPLGFLVHEYHHYLTQRGGTKRDTYLDEFAAHWKQYDVQNVRQNLSERPGLLNAWLATAYKCVDATSPELAITHPQDAGMKYWWLVEDNLTRVAPKLPSLLPGQAPPLPTSRPGAGPPLPTSRPGAAPPLPKSRPPV
jgi:hypothetical protein